MSRWIWWVLGGVWCAVIAIFGQKEEVHPERDLADIVPEFPVLHSRTVETFINEESFGRYRLPTDDYWEERSAMIDGKIHYVRELNLIGVTIEEGNRVYESMIRFKSKTTLEEEGFRALSPEQDQAVEILRKGSQPWVEIPSTGEGHCMVAPILAREDCLKCHEGKVGDLLGAFEYQFRSFEN